MTPAPIHLAGERLLLDPDGAVFWPARRLLAVADLHFEKATAAATRGSLLPPWDTAATLDRLAAMARRWRPQTLVALGDSFHDVRGAGRMQPRDQARLRHIAAACDMIWVLGNHDPAPPEGLPGRATADLGVGALRFVHQGSVGPVLGELCGHHHPKAHIQAKGAVVTRSCFVCDGRRLMLPAIGAYTGGLDVRDPAIGGLFPRGGRVFLLGHNRLFSFAMPAKASRMAASRMAALPETVPPPAALV
jgi:DNA ligase-associated metallophosphoesterase